MSNDPYYIYILQFKLTVQIQNLNLNLMDIEYQATPPKKARRNYEFSTPNHKTTPKDTETPKKVKPTFESPDPINSKNLSTPPKRSEKPHSKKVTKNSTNSPSTPYRSPAEELIDDNEITPFYISRLQTDYQFIRYLGLGNFSRVGLYNSRLTQQTFAIKTTQMSLMSVNEVQALGTLSIFSQQSRNIVKYYHSWIEDEKIYIVMEYCQSSLKDIYQYSRSQGKLIDEERLKEMMRQALMGLKCMHEKNMVHLDIKPDNLLIKDAEIKIADLGLCRITRIKRWSDLDEGDTRYLAKEVLNYHQGIDLTKADIYSLGMSIFQGAILEDLPNNGDEWLSIRQNGIDLKRILQMQRYSQEFQQVIASMIDPAWQNRPSCEQLLGLSYFSEQQNKRLSRFLRGSGKKSRKQEGSL